MKHKLLCPLFSLILFAVAALGSTTLNAKTLALTESLANGWQYLVPHSELLEDPQHNWELEQVRQQPGWQPQSSNFLNFGYSKSVYWLRWSFHNERDQAAELIVDLGNPREDKVSWYLLHNNELRKNELSKDERREYDSLHEFVTGDRLPFQQRPLPLARNFALPFTLKPGETVQLYVRMNSYDGLFETIPIKLYQARYFFEEQAQHSLVLTLYHGGLLFLAVYNLLLYFATRERSFLLYVRYLFWFLMWNFTMNGYSFQYFWPNSPVLNNNFLTVCSALSFGLFGLFTIEYLKLRDQNIAWLVRLIQVLSWLNFSVLIFAALDWYAISVAYGQVTGLMLTLVVLGSGLWRLAKGQRQARFFMLAFSMLGVGAAAYILKTVGVIPSNLFTTWGLQFGSAFETLILALGLADSMNVLKQQKLDAERKARAAQEALNSGLEYQVRERTRELAEANQRLQTLAITDELTDTYNRRHFNSICAATLNQQNRQQPVAFCMFDVDHFKRYNDYYGHSAGDTVLQEIAKAIQALLKRSSETLFRLGGEEFGVLFTAKDQKHAHQFVEQMRMAVVDLGIPHVKSKTGLVTASFGVTLWNKVPPPTTDQVYAATDMALYAAKEAGRNTVYFASEEELDSLLSNSPENQEPEDILKPGIQRS